ncbi:MAG TPA: riboflavin synthase [bacterium]|nr:riboflavin synthase [bacterium]
MFTGIITHLGTIAAIEPRGENKRLRIAVPPDFMLGVAQGDSIAVSGICLTALGLTADSFAADVSLETLRRTTLSDRQAGDPLNLERSLRLGDKLGGHLVMGHVDAVGRIAGIEPHGDAVRYRIAVPPELAPLIAHKGSVAVDGISLTPVAADRSGFEVWIIPETLRRTTLGQRRVGEGVNLEVDILSRYVARQLAARAEGLTVEGLRAKGF